MCALCWPWSSPLPPLSLYPFIFGELQAFVVCPLGCVGTLALGHSGREPAEGQSLWLPTPADLVHTPRDGCVSPTLWAPPLPNPVTHLAQVVKVVLVPDPSVTGLSTV